MIKYLCKTLKLPSRRWEMKELGQGAIPNISLNFIYFFKSLSNGLNTLETSREDRNGSNMTRKITKK